jgi:O-antigen/teichoic acid export membrane protein
VYGERWLTSAAVLTWLAVAGITRIFFELSYDYLVVRAATRSILVVQVLWLIALPPALLAGAHYFGLVGAAAGQVLVSVVVVVPAYCVLLRREGVRLAGLAREIAPSVLAGGAIVGFTYGVAHWVSRPLTACILSGLLALMVAAFLLFLKRRDLALIRSPRMGTVGT